MENVRYIVKLFWFQKKKRFLELTENKFLVNKIF